MEKCTPEQAAQRVHARDSLAIPLGPGQPRAFLRALGERERFEDLRVFGALLVDLFPLFTRPGVQLLSGFFGPAERALRAAGHAVSFVPGDFRRFARIARELAPRVVATNASAPDAHGRVSLSLHAGATVGEIQRAARDPARLLVVETSPHLPRTLGLAPHHDHSLALEDADVWIESDMQPPLLPDSEPDEVDRAIAAHVRAFVPEGATLQTGIGAVPGQVVKLLAEGPGGDYGIHSEMFTDALMRLHLAGKVTNRKGLYDGVSIATFAMGSGELYRWLDGCQEVRFLPVHLVNDPGLIARNRRMISLNGALSIDLAGQVVADSIDGVQYSGIGGHEDFVSGAGLSEGDRSIVCLPSTARVRGERRSRIVARHPAGALVTTPRHQLDVVVTEHGAAELSGLSVEARARALLALAAPDLRPELEAALAQG